MPNFKRLKESLDWLSHGKLIVEVIFAIAGMKVVRGLIMSFTQIPAIWLAPVEWASAGILLAILILVFNRRPSIQQIASVNSSLLSTSVDGRLPPDVDINEFFRTAYASPQQPEVEKNFRLLAAQQSPGDPASFYLKFIGVGFIQALFDSYWWPLFKSQLVALLEVNSHSGILPLADIKAVYSRAAEEYPDHYATDNFERWLGYLTRNGLMLSHPSGMVEITVRGKDFLKYLVHWGRSPNDKRL